MSLDDFLTKVVDDCVNARYYPRPADIGMCDDCGDEDEPRRLVPMSGLDAWLCPACQVKAPQR